MRKVLIGVFLSVFLSVGLIPVSVLAEESVEAYYLYNFFDGKLSDPVERRLFELVMFSGKSDEAGAVLKNLTVACEENLFDSVYVFLDQGNEFDLVSENVGGMDYYSFSGELEFAMNSPQINVWGDIADVAEGRLVGCSLEKFEVSSENGELISLNNGINDRLDKIERNFFEYSDDEVSFVNENEDLLKVYGSTHDLYFNQDNQSLVSGDFTFQDGAVLKEIYLECRNGGLFDEVRFELDGGQYEMSPTAQTMMYIDYADYLENEMIEDRVIFRTADLDVKLENLNSTEFNITVDVGDMRFMDEFPNCSSNIKYELKDKVYGTSNFFTNGDLFQSYWGSTDILKRSHYSKKSIEVLHDSGIIEGYPDGRFRPNTLINRAEMSKILAEAYLDESELISESCFDDVLEEDWFSKYVCALKRKGYVSGDDNSNNFRPGDGVNFAESMKMIVEVLEFDIREGDIPGRNFDEKNYWHGKYITTAIYNGFYSLDYYVDLGREMLRGDAFISLYFAINSKDNSELREEFVVAVEDLIGYVDEYQNPNMHIHHSIRCEADSFRSLEIAQSLYANLMNRDAHLNMSSRWDIIDRDERYTFFIASDFIEAGSFTSVPVMIQSGCLDLLKEENFTDISEIDDLFYNSRFHAIHYGVMSGNIEVVDYLISLGADVNEVVDYLISLGADVNEVVDYLISLGADVNEVVNYIVWHPQVGNEYQLNSMIRPLSTVLHVLADSNYSIDEQITMANHLLDLGVDLKEEDNMGRTSLSVARWDNNELAEYLSGVCEEQGLVCD